MPLNKLTPAIVGLIQPLIRAEEGARYFYEGARTWAKQTEYCGARRQFKCFVHYHKHNTKELMDIFARWDTLIAFQDIPGPVLNYTGGLPGILQQALEVEENLIDAYNPATAEIMGIDLNIHKYFENARSKAQEYWEEMREFNEKLQLIDTGNKLSILYYDRKILRW